ncbi:hypothetical protein EDD21DRAFT_410307 [Dissophora ornata]|nr:hypothetical protein BGZ58_000895 [Dissophora ornata]KAI8606283.1 hypothetical protein EDD21DRAFT_410307 [Dissophora ornata]
MSSLNIVREYLFGGAEEILALTTPVTPLEKRDLMRIEKRYDQCSSSTYCRNGYHCVSTTLCKKNTNYAWTAVFGVLLLLLICLCIRRRRARAMTDAPQTVVATTFPQQSYAPPAGDPNLAYQTPATYPPPTGAYAAPPTGAYPAYSAPYTGETYPPLQAPPAAYSAYPAASDPYPPAPVPYSASPAPGHTGAYPALATAYPSNPYPAPQGEAASYAPPVHK